MRSILTLTIVILCTISCKKVEQPEHVTIYNLQDFHEKIIIKDTLCEHESKRAQEDIKQGKLTLSLVNFLHRTNAAPRHMLKAGELEERLRTYLKEYKILLDTSIIPYNDIRSICDNLFIIDCYQQVMKEEITKRYGGLFDSLVKKAEKQHVLAYPNDIYDLSNLDRRHHNANGRKFEDCKMTNEVIFASTFTYPSTYKTKAERSFSHTTAEFILMDDGTISNLKVHATFHNPDNEKFRNYFEDRLKVFVKRAKWVTGSIHGIPVNTNIRFTFSHK